MAMSNEVVRMGTLTHLTPTQVLLRVATVTGRVHVIGAATSAGAHGPGQEEAPDAFRRYGLMKRLDDAGLEATNQGNVVRLRMHPDPEHPRLASAARVVDAAHTVAGHVQHILEAGRDDRVLVLDGDCTIQLGVIAGAKAAVGDSVGRAYIDLDCDLTSLASGNGIADWMGITHLLDAPDADPDGQACPASLRCSLPTGSDSWPLTLRLRTSNNASTNST